MCLTNQGGFSGFTKRCRKCRSRGRIPWSTGLVLRTGTHGHLSIEDPCFPHTMSPSSIHASPDLAPTNSPHGMDLPDMPVQEVHKTRASWKENEQHILPQNRLWLVFPGLMCCVFLAALDQVRSQLCLFSRCPSVCSLQQTIVATALPTIVEHLGGGKNYSWVGRYFFFLLPRTL